MLKKIKVLLFITITALVLPSIVHACDVECWKNMVRYLEGEKMKVEAKLRQETADRAKDRLISAEKVTRLENQIAGFQAKLAASHSEIDCMRQIRHVLDEVMVNDYKGICMGALKTATTRQGRKGLQGSCTWQ